MKKERKSTDKKNVFARLDKNIPAQKMALDNLEAYQKQTGLTQKDALVFILLELQSPLFKAGTRWSGQEPLQNPASDNKCDVHDVQEDRMTEKKTGIVPGEKASSESEPDNEVAEDKNTEPSNINDFLTENFDYD